MAHISKIMTFCAVLLFLGCQQPTDPPAKSGNANLSGITITGNTLNETISESVTSYTANVAYDVESITITATKADAKATVVGAGTLNLVDGANVFTITVTAENGTSKVYTLTVTRASPATYTVTFDSNGGTAVTAISGITSGAKITSPTDPTKTSNNFSGWYKEVELTTAWVFGTDTVTADTTLYAKWTVIPIIYAGGFTSNSSGIYVPGYWKDGIGTALTPLDATKSALVNSLVISGNDVYAGGYSNNNASVNVAGYWKNGAWTGLPSLDATKGSGVHSLVISGTDVYAGGYSANSLNVSVAGYWKNGTWTGLPSLDATKGSGVQTLVLDGTDIYAVGTSYPKNRS